MTADGHFSHEIKRHLLLERKAMANLDSILKSRDITLPTKIHLVKATVFPVVMQYIWDLDHKESWVLKNWCFWIVVLGETLRVPWTARRSNQSILKEINPEYSLEGLMLKLLYFGHLMQRADSLEKILMLGKIEGGRRRWQRMRWVDGITDSMDMSLSKLGSWWWTGKPGTLQSMGSQTVGHDWATELNWTERMGGGTTFTWVNSLKLSLRLIYSNFTVA